MPQRYIREFPMTAVEGSLMYKLERKDINTTLEDRRRSPKICCSSIIIRCCARQAESVGRRDRCVETT